jgi:hypothetical protein
VDVLAERERDEGLARIAARFSQLLILAELAGMAFDLALHERESTAAAPAARIAAAS